MLYDHEASREIFIVFQDNDTFFGSSLFKKGFSHCYALERQALGWICIDPSRRDCLSHILPAGFLDPVMDLFIKQNPTSTVMQLFVSRHLDVRHTYPRLGLISCVGMLQYNLGVYWPLIITPHQLYSRLSLERTSHIKVGLVWQARALNEKPEQQQKHHAPRRRITEPKRPRYRKKQSLPK